MAFFHTTPLGRIINRLTKDTVDVDKNLADFAAFFLRSLLQLLSTVALIGFETPFALPALVPILLFFYFLYAYFQARCPGASCGVLPVPSDMLPLPANVIVLSCRLGMLPLPFHLVL